MHLDDIEAHVDKMACSGAVVAGSWVTLQSISQVTTVKVMITQVIMATSIHQRTDLTSPIYLSNMFLLWPFSSWFCTFANETFNTAKCRGMFISHNVPFRCLNTFHIQIYKFLVSTFKLLILKICLTLYILTGKLKTAVLNYYKLSPQNWYGTAHMVTCNDAFFSQCQRELAK